MVVVLAADVAGYDDALPGTGKKVNCPAGVSQVRVGVPFYHFILYFPSCL